MEDIFKDIKRAQQSEAYYSALALALTIPDICCNHDKSITGKGGERYKNWYNKYARTLNDTNFNGAHCYALRCAYLHDGNADIENQVNAYKKTGDEGKDLKFNIRVQNFNEITTSFIINDIEKNEKIVDVNINLLINAILIAYRQFKTANPNVSIERKNIIF